MKLPVLRRNLVEEDLVAALRWEVYTGVMSMHLKWYLSYFLKSFPEVS